MEPTLSGACAYLSDDDHGPLALQEILLAGCPTVGVRTGASFVRTGESGVVVDRLPPGAHGTESDSHVRALAVFMEAIEQAQSMDRRGVRDLAASEFDTDRIVDSVITAAWFGPGWLMNQRFSSFFQPACNRTRLRLH